MSFKLCFVKESSIRSKRIKLGNFKVSKCLTWNLWTVVCVSNNCFHYFTLCKKPSDWFPVEQLKAVRLGHSAARPGTHVEHGLGLGRQRHVVDADGEAEGVGEVDGLVHRVYWAVSNVEQGGCVIKAQVPGGNKTAEVYHHLPVCITDHHLDMNANVFNPYCAAGDSACDFLFIHCALGVEG